MRLSHTAQMRELAYIGFYIIYLRMVVSAPPAIMDGGECLSQYFFRARGIPQSRPQNLSLLPQTFRTMEEVDSSLFYLALPCPQPLASTGCFFVSFFGKKWQRIWMYN